jgi:chromosome segregation ATPase
MKRALSVAAVTALSLLVFLFVGYAQERSADSIAELLDQELTAMEAAFGSLEAFMAELIREVKGNMSDIVAVNARVSDLRNTVEAVSIEIKTAEGKIIGLRTDADALRVGVDALGETQQEFKVRIVALEAGLSELSAFVGKLSERLDVTGADLGMLRAEFDALIADYAVLKDAFAAFQESISGDIAALRDGIYADLGLLRDDIYSEFGLLRDDIYGELGLLQTDVFSELGVLKDGFAADISLLSITVDDLSRRVLSLEKEDVGTFKNKVIEMERSMAALSIRIDNNRAKLEGFDRAVANLSDEMMATRESVLEANQALLSEYDARLVALESVDLQPQIDTLYFISIVALLAGVGALIWAFLGTG